MSGLNELNDQHPQSENFCEDISNIQAPLPSIYDTPSLGSSPVASVESSLTPRQSIDDIFELSLSPSTFQQREISIDDIFEFSLPPSTLQQREISKAPPPQTTKKSPKKSPKRNRKTPCQSRPYPIQPNQAFQTPKTVPKEPTPPILTKFPISQQLYVPMPMPMPKTFPPVKVPLIPSSQTQQIPTAPGIQTHPSNDYLFHSVNQQSQTLLTALQHITELKAFNASLLDMIIRNRTYLFIKASLNTINTLTQDYAKSLFSNFNNKTETIKSAHEIFTQEITKTMHLMQGMIINSPYNPEKLKDYYNVGLIVRVKTVHHAIEKIYERRLTLFSNVNTFPTTHWTVVSEYYEASQKDLSDYPEGKVFQDGELLKILSDLETILHL